MKRLKDITLGIAIGMLLVGVPVMAISYIPSKDVSYKTDYNENVTNVEEALDVLTNQVKEINNTGNSLSSDILSGKTAYVNGKLLTGTIANYSGATKAGSNITESGSNVEITIPEGYYDSNSKVSVPVDTIKQNVQSMSGTLKKSVILDTNFYLEQGMRNYTMSANVSHIDGYEHFTANNFSAAIFPRFAYVLNIYGMSVDLPSISYNPSTGIVTCTTLAWISDNTSVSMLTKGIIWLIY